MGLLDFLFGRRPATAGIAKERLQIVLAHERASRDTPDFLPALQKELLAVVGKYVVIKDDFVRVKIGRQSDASVLEINVELDPTAAKPPETTAPPPAEPPKPANKVSPPRSKSVGRRR